MSLKTFFFPVSVIIAVVLLIWFIMPEWGVVQDKRTELFKKEEAVKSINDKKEKIIQGIAVYENNIRDASIVYQALPNEIENDSLVDEIFKGAKDKGVLITSITIDDVNPAEKSSPVFIDEAGMAEGSEEMGMIGKAGELDTSAIVRNTSFEIPFSLEIVGGYLETKNFIDFLESANRFFSISKVSINSSDSSSALTVSISGTSFYKGENPDLMLSSIIYTNDPVLKSLVSGKGLDIDFVSEYKSNLIDSAYSFNPNITGIGKENIFLNQNNNVEEDVVSADIPAEEIPGTIISGQ